MNGAEAQEALGDRVVGVALDVDDATVALLAGMHNGPTPHPTIAANGGGLLGILGLEHLSVRLDRLQVKSQPAHRKPGSRGPRDLNKLPACDLHIRPHLPF